MLKLKTMEMSGLRRWLAMTYLVCAMLLFSGVCFAQYVQNLTVTDYPNDDGSGLVIKFNTLPLENRIIEYRIYRGLTPDSLFYLGKIETDPKIGVPGGELIFMDRDFRTFVDIESPRRLRAEKGYPKEGPIFRALPRDLSVIGPMFDHFDFLTIIDKNIYYRKTQKHLQESEEGTDLLGGLKIEEFEGILANVLPGKPYYYTVIAVNETGRLLPHAPIVSGIAVDNMPLPSPQLHAVLINRADDNTPLQLNFEFELPITIDDIAQYSIYMIEKAQLPALNRFKDYMIAVDDWNTRITLGDTLAVQPDEVDNPGTLISVATTLTFSEVSINSPTHDNGVASYYIESPIDESPIPFNPDKIDDYLFYITLDDLIGFQTAGEPISAKVATTDDLPILPPFIVRDKPSDKGDIIEISIGRPLVMLTQFNFRNTKNRAKLAVAYSYMPNPHIKVKSIRFDFTDHKGEPIVNKKGKPLSITEHYLDNLFNLTLPDTSLINTGFRVYMTFNAPKSEIHNQTYLYQDIHWDNELMSLRPQNLFEINSPTHDNGVVGSRRGAIAEELLNFRYTIVKQAKNTDSSAWRVASKATPYINLIDDMVPYEKYFFKGIAGYDSTSNRILVDTYIDLGWDEELQTTVMTSLFLDEFIANFQTMIDQYSEMLAEDPENEDIAAGIEELKSLIAMQETHPYLAKANQMQNPRQRINEIMKTREELRRTFRYYLVKTDQQGLFAKSDIYRDPTSNSNEWFFPTPDWFDTKTIPTLIATLIFGFFVLYFSLAIKRGKHTYIRPIAGLEEVDNAIGRATEMGRPILYVPGLSSIDDVATLAGLAILGHITKKAAEYDSRMIVPVCDYIVLPTAQQIVKEAHTVAGRPDSYNSNDIFFVASGQFAYVAGVNGVMIREKTATNFYMGMFWAEALIMTETGNQTGAIQVAGTDALTQIPFFITTCDYTLIGEELYGAAAYLTRDPTIMGTLKSQDYTKLLIIICIIIGSILSTLNITFFINAFPAE